MDFRLTDEQRALRDSARQLLDAECTAELVRARYDDDSAIPERLAQALAAQGWPALLVPEEHGGLGLGVIELCLVLEEAGRALVPAPLWSTAGLYVPLVLACADKDQAAELLPAIVSGSLGTAAIAEADGRWSPAASATTAVQDRSAWTVSGIKRLVPEAASAHTLLVTAVAPDGPGLFVVDGANVTCRWLETVDRSRALYDVTLDAAPAYRLTNGDPDAIAGALEIGAVTVAAELLGTARWILDTTSGYAKVREQFDVPIGTFQAVQHMLADNLLELERAWAGTYWAAMCIDAETKSDRDDRSRAAAIAKASAGDAARAIAKDGIQIHGGIGYTWEHDLHLYIRRTYAAESLLGGADEQRRRLADLLAL
jgi:alkylation response protein AidB-like acyl-CoA dehydrogenase